MSVHDYNLPGTLWLARGQCLSIIRSLALATPSILTRTAAAWLAKLCDLAGQAASAEPAWSFSCQSNKSVPAHTGFFLPGYFRGKRNAEQSLFSLFPQGGVAVRPTFMHGNRQVGSSQHPTRGCGYPPPPRMHFSAELASLRVLSSAPCDLNLKPGCASKAIDQT